MATASLSLSLITPRNKQPPQPHAPSLLFVSQLSTHLLNSVHVPSTATGGFVQSTPQRSRRGRTLLLKPVASAMTTGFSSDIGDALGVIEIFRASGESVTFKDLWDQQQGVAVVALLRHFGCPCCWELAAELKKVKHRFDSDVPMNDMALAKRL
ncbi:unnamed protein product [Rhodiola kirilowii]